MTDYPLLRDEFGNPLPPPSPPKLADIPRFQQGDKTWTDYRKRSLEDLYWFAAFVLGYGEQIPMKPDVHGLMCKFVEKTTGHAGLDACKYRKIEVPREVGKTTCITQGYPIQRICRDRNVSILIANEKEGTAKDMLSAIKWQFESNEFLRALFPEVIPDDLNDTTWSATRITVKRDSGRKEPTIFVIGVGGTVTGMHPDVIIVDDAISREAMENARAGAWQIMHAVNRWINQLDPLVNKGAKPFPEIIFIGTRWWHGDCYEHIETAFGYGEPHREVNLRLRLPDGSLQHLLPGAVYVIGDLAVFRRPAIENGRSIFPEKWSLEDLAKIRLRDPALFACNYMNEPSDDVTATFKQDWIKPLVWLDDTQFYVTDETAKKLVLRLQDIDKIILVDPGGFGERVVESRARAAAICVGDDFNNHKFFLDCYSEQDTYLACIRHIVDWCSKYEPRKIYVERAGQQAAFAQLIRVELDKAGLNVPVDDVTIKPGNTNKDVRILEIEPYFQRGEMFVGTGPAFMEFKMQYQQYPRSARKDVLDILGHWPKVMRRAKTNGTKSVEQRRAKELADYHAKRNAMRRYA
jgi:hypothetical protein